eukprot:sb/3470552/
MGVFVRKWEFFVCFLFLVGAICLDACTQTLSLSLSLPLSLFPLSLSLSLSLSISFSLSPSVFDQRFLQPAGIQKSSEELNECRWIVDPTNQQPCGLRFEEVSALGAHVNSHHVKEAPFKCFWENCKNLNHPFSRKYKLIYHIRTHTKEKPHKCPECTKQFTRLESYNLHRKTHMKAASSPASPAPNSAAANLAASTNGNMQA